MPRYIDVDKAKELWNGEHPTQIAMRRIFDDLPTADVVPMIEVESLHMRLVSTYEKLDDAESEVERLEAELAKAKQEVARGIFEEIEKLLECCFSSRYINAAEEYFDFYRADLGFQISELKKKYRLH